MAAYTLDHVTFTYPGRAKPALDDVTLAFGAGDFTLLCGPSGGGKTTLLRHLKPVLTPHGKTSGEVRFNQRIWADVTAREQARLIGFVSQIPDNQIVTDKVWHELAFGLESLGHDNQTIRLRVAEMASFFGLQDWFEAGTSELSGGQKQLLNLASVMAAQPAVLILDEPTSQLDPIAASEFLAAVKKINLDLGVSVIVSEHRLEEAFPLADRVVVLREGKVGFDGSPAQVCENAIGEGGGDPYLMATLPSAARIYAQVATGVGAPSGPCPLTVRDGRRYLATVMTQSPSAVNQSLSSGTPQSRHPNRPESIGRQPSVPRALGVPGVPGRQPGVPRVSDPTGVQGAPAISLREVWFKYDKDGADVLRDFSLVIPQRGLFAILGGNGVGKSTALGVMSGLLLAYRGKISVAGKSLSDYSPTALFDHLLAVLPQNPQSVFTRKTVELDLLDHVKPLVWGKDERTRMVHEAAAQVGLTDLLRCHPYDLSGGEQQRAALAKVLLLRPKILLMDEPTKGLDAGFKATLAGILRDLITDGLTVVMVSHDVEFCAMHADRCALLFNGSVISCGPPGEFFAGHGFYTTAANRIARAYWPDAITVEEVSARCLDSLNPQPA